jgi:F-type H+-transporting ATPase subunit b
LVKIVVFGALLAGAGLLITLPALAQDNAQKAARPETAHSEDAATHGESSGPLGFDPDLAIFTVIVFAALLFILGKFAWPQISAALLERERKIEEQIAAAMAKHEEAKLLLAEHEARLAAAAGEVRALLDEARRDAEHTRKRIEQEGHQAAQDELTRAIREIERAKDGAIEELAKSTANVAVEMARRVVQERITPDEHSALVRTALDRLAAVANPSKN